MTAKRCVAIALESELEQSIVGDVDSRVGS
jgi:hypothetical protein